MPSIAGIGTSVPSFSYSLEEIAGIGEKWLSARPDKLNTFLRFLSASKTGQRFFAIPAEQILNLNGMQARTDHFERAGPKLGVAAVKSALEISGLAPKDFDSFVFTSCSCPSIPSIDAVILEETGFAATTNRIPIYQHGCAGGVVGLGLAARLASLGRPVAFNSVELCSLLFQPTDPTPAELVGSAIFGDGAACAVLVPGSLGLSICRTESYLIRNTRHLMGYNLLDDGFHLRLDRELPSVLGEVAPKRVKEFLAKMDLATTDIQHWLFHPGGVKILNFFENAFKLNADHLAWSRDVLKNYGNLSSATVLFVIKHFIEGKIAKHGDYVLLVGVGPGLTLELVLFQYLEQ